MPIKIYLAVSRSAVICETYFALWLLSNFLSIIEDKLIDFQGDMIDNQGIFKPENDS